MRAVLAPIEPVPGDPAANANRAGRVVAKPISSCCPSRAEGRRKTELITEATASGTGDERLDALAQIPRELPVRTRATTRGATR